MADPCAAPDPLCFGPPPGTEVDPRPSDGAQIVSLYELVTRRIRVAQTLFGQNVKLVLRQLNKEQWALLTPPYLLVVPTMSRPQMRPPDGGASIIDQFVNPRSITMIAQLPANGSEGEWAAASLIELAEKQLLGCLLSWPPQPHYLPTIYGGMKIEGSRDPDVRVSFVFTFHEQLIVTDDEIVDSGPLEISELVVRNVSFDCEPEEQPAPTRAPALCVISGGVPIQGDDP